MTRNIKTPKRKQIISSNKLLKQVADGDNLKGVEGELRNIARELKNSNFRFSKEREDKRHEDNLKIQRKLNWATLITAGSTVLLFVATFILVIITNQTLEFQETLYSPKVDVRIANSKFTIDYYGTGYPYYKIINTTLNQSEYALPVYIEISNSGVVPFQLYTIQFSTECGIGNRGLISFPDNFSKVIEPGDERRFNDDVWLYFDNTIGEGLPCSVDFLIYGKNVFITKKFDVVKEQDLQEKKTSPFSVVFW